MRTSTIDEEPPKYQQQQQQQQQQKADEANIDALLRENDALEAERATIEKYKRMYEAILKDPENAFLFDNGSTCGSASTVGKENNHRNGQEEDDTFTTAVNVEELIRGLKLKDRRLESSA